MDADEAVGGDAAPEEAAQLALHEARHGPATVALARNEGLHLAAEDLVEDAVLGLATPALALPQLKERGFKIRHVEECGQGSTATLGSPPKYVLRGEIGSIACAPGDPWYGRIYLAVYAPWDPILSGVEVIDDRGHTHPVFPAPDR